MKLYEIKRKLDDYFYDKTTGEVVHIYEAQQPKVYNPKEDSIIYLAKSNKRKFDQNRITSKSKWFWGKFRKVSKIKAKLLW